MKKVLKNKKFLALTLGAIVTGASIVAVAAACAAKVSVVEKSYKFTTENEKNYLTLTLSDKISLNENDNVSVVYQLKDKSTVASSSNNQKSVFIFDEKTNNLKIQVSNMPENGTKVLVVAPGIKYNFIYEAKANESNANNQNQGSSQSENENNPKTVNVVANSSKFFNERGKNYVSLLMDDLIEVSQTEYNIVSKEKTVSFDSSTKTVKIEVDSMPKNGDEVIISSKLINFNFKYSPTLNSEETTVANAQNKPKPELVANTNKFVTENEKNYLKFKITENVEESDIESLSVAYQTKGVQPEVFYILGDKETNIVSLAKFDKSSKILKINVERLPQNNEKIKIIGQNYSYEEVYISTPEESNSNPQIEPSSKKSDIQYSMVATLNSNNRPNIEFNFTSQVPSSAKKLVISYKEKDSIKTVNDSEKILINSSNKFVWDSYVWNAGKTYVVSNVKFFDENDTLVSYDDSKQKEVSIPAKAYTLNLEKITTAAKNPQTWSSFLSNTAFDADFTKSSTSAKEIIDPAIKTAVVSSIENAEEKKIYEAVSNVVSNVIVYNHADKTLRFQFTTEAGGVDVKFTLGGDNSNKTLTYVNTTSNNHDNGHVDSSGTQPSTGTNDNSSSGSSDAAGTPPASNQDSSTGNAESGSAVASGSGDASGTSQPSTSASSESSTGGSAAASGSGDASGTSQPSDGSASDSSSTASPSESTNEGTETSSKPTSSAEGESASGAQDPSNNPQSGSSGASTAEPSSTNTEGSQGSQASTSSDGTTGSSPSSSSESTPSTGDSSPEGSSGTGTSSTPAASA